MAPSRLKEHTFGRDDNNRKYQIPFWTLEKAMKEMRRQKWHLSNKHFQVNVSVLVHTPFPVGIWVWLLIQEV